MMIKAEFVNPFLEAAALVFKDMLSAELLRGKTTIKQTPAPSHEIAIILGVTGKITGKVVYSMNLDTAIKLCLKLMPGTTRESLQTEYTDVLGEIGNMITGNAINIFIKNDKDLDVTVPVVVDTRSAENLEFPDRVTLGLNLYSRFGMIEVNIAIN
ncbi:MAG: chemotaxis protein CheX [Spirochaetia bacterium]|nr:chemotaxis protein CheX [Spirochaetia bacterium]